MRGVRCRVALGITVGLAATTLPVFASDWTNSYGGLGRTCYLVSDAVTPPFALAWEFRPDHPLRDAALIAYKRVYLTTKEYYVYALALDGGAVDWKFEAPTGLDEAISFDARNGRVRWRRKVSGNVIHTPQTGTDALYVSTEAGILHALSQYNGREFWGVYLGKPLTMPAVDADLVVVGSGETLLGLRNRDGSVLFKVPLGRPPEYFPALGAGLVYVALRDEVLALDRWGAMKWRYQLHAPISAPLAVTNEGVMVGLLDGTLMMLSPQAGQLVWDKALAGAPLAIAGAGSVVLAGTSQGTVVCLRVGDGAKLWSHDAAHGPVDGIALTEDHIVVTAGRWVGVFVPAPDPPQLVVVKPAPHAPGAANEPGADLTWGTGYENGSPVAEYVVWRCKPGGEWRQVGRTEATRRSFHAPDSDDSDKFAIQAVDARKAPSALSPSVTPEQGEPLITNTRVSRAPYEPAREPVAVTFHLREPATIAYKVTDAEGKPVTPQRTTFLGTGDNKIVWDGRDTGGRPTDTGTYRVSIEAVRGDDTQVVTRPVAVDWRPAAPATQTGGGSAPTVMPAPPSPGMSAGPVAGPVAGPGPAAGTPAASGGTEVGGGKPDHTNNGVRDHGVGEGRDGAGQGKGQGFPQGNKGGK